jgi:YHYH protein
VIIPAFWNGRAPRVDLTVMPVREVSRGAVRYGAQGLAALAVGVWLGGSVGARPQSAKVDVLDVHRLPLGDGRVSGGPERGAVMSCMTRFRGGGAQHDGPWIHGDTWDLTEKTTVRGRVEWPEAQFAITTGGSGRVVSRVVRGNGLPVETPTGQFPIARDDPAFLIDRNPNRIAAGELVLTLPRDPTPAVAPSCVPMGMIGIALNGVAIFNALDDAGRDAVAHEVQDLCSGHPQMRGEYHYHGPSPCLPDETANERLIGYAIDGYGIFSMYDANGRELTNADLDACHGRESVVDWDGRRVSLYHYVLTREYPYTVGCFHGAPVRGGRGRASGEGPGGGRGE